MPDEPKPPPLDGTDLLTALRKPVPDYPTGEVGAAISRAVTGGRGEEAAARAAGIKPRKQEGE